MNLYVGFGMPGIGELGLIFVVVFVLFGGSKFPEVARMFGKGIREVKKVLNDIRYSDDKD